MKTKVYIASIFTLAMAVCSCQKTEFEDLTPNYSSNTEEVKVIDESQLITIPGAHDSNDLIDVDKPKITGVVKEVSDGDEESDDDENVSSN